IATVTGTERDPQCRSQQIATLEDAGTDASDPTGYPADLRRRGYYLTDSCFVIGRQCVAGKSNKGAELLDFVNQNGADAGGS
ncbi:hypothetical protein O5833_28835, partial [Escherichia coli]|nr:hypothetical protein [Escherichia coli]